MNPLQINLQDPFLAQIKKENSGVVIYLVNGFQLKGTIKGYDNFTIFLESPEGKLQMIYKHAVTTINPVKNINSSFLNDALRDSIQAREKKNSRVESAEDTSLDS
jgi:host factor-I protein